MTDYKQAIADLQRDNARKTMRIQSLEIKNDELRLENKRLWEALEGLNKQTKEGMTNYTDEEIKSIIEKYGESKSPYYVEYCIPENEIVAIAGMLKQLLSQRDKLVKRMARRATKYRKSEEENKRLREALEEIGYMDVSQSPSMNMPKEDWLYKLFSKCQWIAKEALAGGNAEQPKDGGGDE